jgi:hypothetical protein
MSETLTTERVCIISLVRTLQFIHGLGGPADRGTVTKGCWTMAEVHVAVICACLTTINPLLSRWFPGLWSEESSGTELEEGQGVDTIGHARGPRRSPEDSELSWGSTTRTWESGSGGSSTVCPGMEMVETEAKGGYKTPDSN